MKTVLRTLTTEKQWFNPQKIIGRRGCGTMLKDRWVAKEMCEEKRQIKKKFLLFLFILAIGCEVGTSGNGWAQVSVQFPFTGSTRSLQPPQPRPELPSRGFKVGQLRVRPSLGFAEVFTDNVFRDKDNRQSDFGHSIAPGIQAHLPIGARHELLVDYRAAQQYYERFPQNDNFLHEAQALLNLDYPGGLKMTFQASQVIDFDPRGSILDIEQPEMTRWNTNTFSGRVGYMGPRMGYRLTLESMQWNFVNNNQGPLRDRFSNRANVTLFAKATQKIHALLGVGVTDTSFADNKQLNNFAYSILTGFSLPFAETLTGEFQIGMTFLNFNRAAIPEDQDPPDGLSRGGDTQERLTMRGDFTWSPPGRLGGWVRVFRDIRQAGVFGASTFTSTGFFGNLSYRLTDKTNVWGGMSYSLNDFEAERGAVIQDRVDHMLGPNLGLSYQVTKWLGVNFQYRYTQRVSSIPESEFYANNIMLAIQGAL